MAKVTLAAANVKISHDKGKNLSKFIELIDEAGERGVDVLVLPEVGLQGYADFAHGLGVKEAAMQKQYYFREAEEIPGPATDAIREKCAEHGLFVQLGLAERAAHGNVILNSTALVGPEGVVGVFRKVHNQFEFPYFNAGHSFPVFDLPFARVGGLICYDLAFPEAMRILALKGATVALKSTAWPMRGHDRATDYHGEMMDLSSRANAFFNQMWLVVSNHCEKDVYSGGLDYWGNSQIVDPYGHVVAMLGDEEGLVVHTADLDQTLLDSRTDGFFGLNLIQDRRPELYEEIADSSLYSPSNQPQRLQRGANGVDEL